MLIQTLNPRQDGMLHTVQLVEANRCSVLLPLVALFFASFLAFFLVSLLASSLTLFF